MEGVDVRFVQGDLLISDAEAIVNAVNCVGVMGRGLALQFKRTFPANFKAYAAACKRGEGLERSVFGGARDQTPAVRGEGLSVANVAVPVSGPHVLAEKA